jgi:hypothetical protein
MDRRQRIHELLAKMSDELLEYIKEIETSYKHRWVPSVDIKKTLAARESCTKHVSRFIPS